MPTPPIERSNPSAGSPLARRLLSGLTLVLSCQAQVTPEKAHLFTHEGGAADSHYGFRISRAGDVDGDGHADVLVGSPLSAVGGRLQVGKVYVYSGADGRTLREVAGDPARDIFFGWPVRDAGDVDADGTPDFAATTRTDVVVVSGRTGGEVWRATVGFATDAGLGRLGDTDRDGRDDLLVSTGMETMVLSGRDGSVLSRRTGQITAAAAGDCDGDGVGDIVLGEYAFAGTGRVLLLSGRNGSVLQTIAAPVGTTSFGRYVSAAGDVDGDGVPDVIVGDRFGTSAMFVHSGRDGALLRQVAGGSAPPAFPCVGAGDVDGDGHGDVVMTRQWGHVVVVSGRTWAEVAVFRKTPGGIFGLSVDGVGDVNGDGFGDVLVGDYTGGARFTGSAHVLSGRALALTTGSHAVSIGAGGTQALRFDLGPENGGAAFVCLGSASGFEPGIALGGGVHLPLNPDAYTMLTGGSLGLLFTPAVGTLDAAGVGTCVLTWPSALAVAPGTRLHHAALIFAPSLSRLATATNAAPLLLR